MNKQKLLRKILASPNNARFDEFLALVEAFGFRLTRISGSHHIFTHLALAELLNIQEVDGQAKPYQIRQFFRLVEQYNLQLEDI